MISIMVAMDKNCLIGKNNALPWRLPADLAYFKKATTGHTVIMGRKTFESIGKPLPARRNVVVTRNKVYRADGCVVCHSIEEALAFNTGEGELFIIGGADIFAEFLPWVDRLYITHIMEEFDGEIYFRGFDETQWNLISSVQGEKNERNPYEYYFLVYDRKEA